MIDPVRVPPVRRGSLFAEWFDAIPDDPPGSTPFTDHTTTDPLPQAPVPTPYAQIATDPLPQAPVPASSSSGTCAPADDEAPAVAEIRAVPALDEVLARLSPSYERPRQRPGEARAVGPLPPPPSGEADPAQPPVIVTDSVLNGHVHARPSDERELRTVLSSQRPRELVEANESPGSGRWKFALLIAAAITVGALVLFLNRPDRSPAPVPHADTVPSANANALSAPATSPPSSAASGAGNAAASAAPEPTEGVPVSPPSIASAPTASSRPAPRATGGRPSPHPTATPGSGSAKPSSSAEVPFDHF
jgi:hypothetical protein